MEYENRYGEIYSFVVNDEGNVEWRGKFKCCRFGFPNNYDAAYKAYYDKECQIPHDHTLSLDQFKIAVHEYDEDYKPLRINKEYASLVTSNVDLIGRIDPSGGPYLCVGADLGDWLDWVELNGKVVSGFERRDYGYEILIEK